MCLKPINFGVTFIYRLQKIWGEKADGWEKTEPNQVGNNLLLIDIKVKKREENEYLNYDRIVNSSHNLSIGEIFNMMAKY